MLNPIKGLDHVQRGNGDCRTITSKILHRMTRYLDMTANVLSVRF